MFTDEQYRIVVGIDDSDQNDAALAWAAEQARLTDGKLFLLSAWGAPTRTPEPRAMTVSLTHEDAQTALEKAAASLQLPSERVYLLSPAGAPGPRLVAASGAADLLVVGTGSTGADPGFLIGSTAAYCVTHAHCAVTVVPSARL